VANLFFLLSGEHEDLPTSEVKAILETEDCAYVISEKLDQVLRLRADPSCLESLKRRAAFTRMCALELFNCDANTTSIMRAFPSADVGSVLKNGESFGVRVKHVKTFGSDIDGMALEGKLGRLILDGVSGTRVNLKNPDKAFVGILTSNRFVFGLKLAEIAAKQFVERRPRKKPFFHPSAMQAKLARCMVNLARPKSGDLVLDPFCGTGGMLIEAALIGCRILAMDIQLRMVKGALKNFTHFKIEPEGVIIGDARSIPLEKTDCLVTDPPYGRSTMTFRRTTSQLIQQVLTSVHSLIEKGRRVCMAAPKTLNVVAIGTSLGYRHIESHFVYVHRNLTREIVVFEKA
jgi:tRNA (guanine10-N2)-dimethyltransferase